LNIKEIAKKCNVSVATVSRVINKSPKVDPETREKVRKVIEKYKYTPHFFAQALSKSKLNVIGFIVPSTISISSSYFIEILKGIEKKIKECNYELLLKIEEGKIDYDNFLRSGKVDGLIILAPLNKSLRLKNKENIVVMNAKIEDVSRIDVDNIKGAILVMEHLISIGHKKIGILNGFMEGSNAKERFEGYLMSLKKYNLVQRKEWVLYGDYNFDKAYKEVYSLYKRGGDLPTALFCSNDLMAMGAIKALNDLNIHVPEEISVTGFDDIKESSWFSPPLTTVRQPFFEMGVSSVDLLLEKINAKILFNKNIIFEPVLITRRSTAKCLF